MPITPARTLTTPAARSVYERLLRSYTLSLTAQGMSPRTIETYTHSVRDFAIFLEARGMPLEPHALSREHVEEFIAHLRTAVSPLTKRPYSVATANNRHRATGVLSLARGDRRAYKFSNGEHAPAPHTRIAPRYRHCR
jgi:hypothetical protein